ncbi:MAG: hypothetical protein K2P53_02395 [Rickettsiales bacterium]|nr:hypothetical protein [Rickettsiales bacterium]
MKNSDQLDNINNEQNTQNKVEKIIDTERISNKEESIFANLCSNTSTNKTNNEKTLGGNLNNYFDSDEIKKELKNIGVPVNKYESVTKKLKEYSGRHTQGKIDLDKLKAKFYSYFEELKSINKDIISKNNHISSGIDKIKKEISSRITAVEVNQTDITFRENSPRESDDQDKGNKSYIDIPHLDLSPINNPYSKKNHFLDDSHGIVKLVTELAENYDKIKEEGGLKTKTSITDDVSEKFDKIKEEGGLKTKTSITELLSEFAEKITNGDINKFKIKTLLKIYENKLGYKISPETEKLIIDLVLETEKYIESVKQIVKDYEMSDETKAKILKAIDNSTSKKSLEENIGKFEKGKEILKLMPKEKQAEDGGVYSKMKSKINKLYDKVCNKYYGYTNLSEQQIDEITKHVKMISSTLDSSSKLDYIIDMDEFVKTKGYTVEDNLNNSFHEMHQSAQTQLHEVENEVKDATIDESNPCNNVYCYATAAVTAILLAIQFMNSYDNEVSYHGFGPSGH